MKKIRVLESVESLGIGGNEMFVMNFFRHLNKDKFQVDFLVYEDRKDFEEEVISAGSKVYYCTKYTGNKLTRFLKQKKFALTIINKYQYDIIHCHGCSFFGILRGVLPAKKMKNIKIISHAHNVGKDKFNFIEHGIRNIFKCVLSNSVDYGFSCSDLAGLSKYTKKFIDSPKYAIIHNAIEIDKYKFDVDNRRKIRNKYNLSEKKVIGNVGRLANQKNQTRLIDIFSKIALIDPLTVLLIVGGGELEDSLKMKVEELNLQDRVIFTGNVNNAEKYYSAMDIFVMTSFFEGLPFTAIEAQANGLNCILSDSVTKMSNISDKVSFISLNESNEVWADNILDSIDQRYENRVLDDGFQNYDLNFEAKRLENYYYNLMGENDESRSL